uniref:Uncharacterized protein LOC105642649 isoform X2 n=1 Tax=Rhizophora mucronata TaxID=61149 RepID=A0A2P2L4H9_RHIMU
MPKINNVLPPLIKFCYCSSPPAKVIPCIYPFQQLIISVSIIRSRPNMGWTHNIFHHPKIITIFRILILHQKSAVLNIFFNNNCRVPNISHVSFVTIYFHWCTRAKNGTCRLLLDDRSDPFAVNPVKVRP